MIRSGLVAWAFCFGLGAAQGAHAAGCYDISKGEPHTLTGTLDYVVFPGPPNYKDVQGGDAPEPNYVLRLPGPICLTGDDFADPQKPFSAVQVLATDATAGPLHDLLHKQATLTLRAPLAAESGHHHEPLVAWVTSAQPADGPPATADAAAPVTAQAVEFGAPGATVRAFYEALGQAQGEVATLLVAPEKRGIPAFSPAAMSRFYGGLQEPIRLVGMSQSGPDTFIVSYRYAAGASVCNGKAVVTTSTREGASYIENIRALNGC